MDEYKLHGVSAFMTVLDAVCHSAIAEYGAQLRDENPTNERAARIYHALADVRDAVQHALPDGVYADLDRATRTAIEHLKEHK